MSMLDITKQLTTQYCVLRYKQEKALKAFKASLDLEIKDLIQSIHEEGISQRNLDNHRTAFDKLIGTHDYSYSGERVKTPAEKAEIIFDMMLDVRRNSVLNITGYTTKTPSRGFLVTSIPKNESVKVRNPIFIMLPSFN